MEELKFKAYLFTYNNHARNYAESIQGLTIVAKDKKEAIRMFETWQTWANFRFSWNMELLNIKNIRKNKNNARCFTDEWYKREWEKIHEIQEAPLTRPYEGGRLDEE